MKEHYIHDVLELDTEKFNIIINNKSIYCNTSQTKRYEIQYTRFDIVHRFWDYSDGSNGDNGNTRIRRFHGTRRLWNTRR
jgi:hypothetical protein